MSELSNHPLVGTPPHTSLDRGSGGSRFIEVVRSRDLVSLHVEARGFAADAGKGVLTAGRGAILIVNFPYQHLGEPAFYESGSMPVPDPDDPSTTKTETHDDETPPLVVPVLPSRKSRVVLDIPAGATIPLTSAGLLEALTRFPMRVHPLARPAQKRTNAVFVVPGLTPSQVEALCRGGMRVPIHSADPILGREPVLGVEPLSRTEPSRIDLSRVEGVALFARAARLVRAALGGTTGALTPGSTPSVPDLPIARLPELSRDAAANETAIEAPFRLVLSPSVRGGWACATRPVSATPAGNNVELWHARLGVRTSIEAPPSERPDPERVVRAVWARDREAHPDWATEEMPAKDDPFKMSLTPSDRHLLVRQTSETWLSQNGAKIAPAAIGADRLWLSSLGAWLDLHGLWETQPWSDEGRSSILSYDHEAQLGRDQYVRVAYPGYLYPLGHRAALVKVTERKMKTPNPSRAILYQQKFIVVGEPIKTYGDREFPFRRVEVTPRVTPPLFPVPGAVENSFYVPRVGGNDFQFVLNCTDWDNRLSKVAATLIWVAESYQEPGTPAETPGSLYDQSDEQFAIAALGQPISFVPSRAGGADTALPTSTLRFAAMGPTDAGQQSEPKLAWAKARIPAAEQVGALGEQQITYDSDYVHAGFPEGPDQGEAEVWAEVKGAPTLKLGAADSSEGGGGFVQPDTRVDGLSRTVGIVGDRASAKNGTFDPSAALSGVVPKLFGLVELSELLDTSGLGDAPHLVTESVATVEGFLRDLDAYVAAVDAALIDSQRRLADANDQADDLQTQGRSAVADGLVADATVALNVVTAFADDVKQKAKAVMDAFAAAITLALEQPDQAVASLTPPMAQFVTLLAQAEEKVASASPLVRERLRTLASALARVATAADAIASMVQFLAGLGAGVSEGRFSYTWRPKLKVDHPIVVLRPDSLTIAVEGRVAASGPPLMSIAAELRSFALVLPPGDGCELVRLPFDHLSFRTGSSGKTDVSVVVGNVQFVGLLGFVERMKQLIPFDGFSDPPYLDVSASGVVAGYSLALPNLALGPFSLSNMALAADVRVPFLGDVVSVGFSFCSRERPFTVAVLCLGGGGWLEVRLSPRGLEVLELGLEVGAYLSIDFGVASGSLSAALGIYLRMEGSVGQLTGYFRVRGEVRVLAIASASIELYLALHYDFSSGKLIGEAVLTLKIKLFCFSKSVDIHCQRQFAGSNGDPSFAEILGVAAGETKSTAWAEYCQAFAKE